jgi:biopolymer transport protein ExbD
MAVMAAFVVFAASQTVSAQEASMSSPIQIGVSATGEYSWNGEVVSREQLASRIASVEAETDVRLMPADDADYQSIGYAVLLLQQRGLIKKSAVILGPKE